MQGIPGAAFLPCSQCRHFWPGAEQEVERQNPPPGWREEKQDQLGQAGSSLEEHSWCDPTQILYHCLKAVIVILIPIQPWPPGRLKSFGICAALPG